MKNYKLVLIILFAIILRLNYNIFLPGYNYDEIAIASTAIQSFPFGILKTAATNDYHAPLYQLIIHFFTYIPNEYLYIRLFNLLLSIVNVYYFYKIGCLMKNKTAGYVTALIISVNHLVVSAVSFVKFYTLSILLVSIGCYYFIKILKYNEGYYKLAISSGLLILTSTYGIVLIFLEYLYLFMKNKQNKKFFYSSLICIFSFLLYLPIFVSQVMLSYSNLFSPHANHPGLSIISIYNVFNDFFAPLLNYCCNLDTISAFTLYLKFIESVVQKNIQIHYLIEFIIFSIIPVLIVIFFIIKGSLKNTFVRHLSIIAILFLVSFALMTELQLTGLIPIYIYPSAILFLATVGIGFCECKKRKATILLLVIYFAINLFIVYSYPPSKRGVQSSKFVYCIDRYLKQNPDIKLIPTFAGRFIAKYYKNNTIFDFDAEKMCGSFGKDYISLIFGKDVAKKVNKKNADKILLPLIESKFRNPDFERYFLNTVYYKVNKGEKVVLAFYNEEDTTLLNKDEDEKLWISTRTYRYNHTKENIKDALNDYSAYLNTATMTSIIDTYSYKYLIDLLEKYFTRIKFEQYSKDTNDNWVKNFEDYSNTYSTIWLAENTTSSWIFITYQKQ